MSRWSPPRTALHDWRNISITLIEAVVTLAPLYIAQKPIAACLGKQLKLHNQGGAVFAAHKQMISAKPELTCLL
jgi:hypothetical protein